MKRLMGCILVVVLFSSSMLAQLPSAPPPTPGGLGEQEAVVENTVQDSSPSSTQSINLNEVDSRITALEKKVDKLELDSGIFSLPFIILLSINITLIILIVYFFFLHKPAFPQ